MPAVDPEPLAEIARTRQRGISYPAFERLLPDEESCREFLFWLRNGRAKPCQRCGSATTWHRKRGSMIYRSACCGAQASVTRGTPMFRTLMGLWTWIYALVTLLNMSACPSAGVLARHLGVSKQCAFNMLIKIRRQMGVICRQGMESLEGHELFVDQCYIRNVKTRGYRGTGKLSVLIVSDGRNVFGLVMQKRHQTEYCRLVHSTGCARVHTRWPTIHRQLRRRSRIETRLLPIETSYYSPQLRAAYHLALSFAVYLQRSFRIIGVPVARDRAQLYIDEYTFRFNFAGDKAMLYPLFLSSLAPL